ncbi:MAG: zeta toxin family protein [Planctomycetota bacterium]
MAATHPILIVLGGPNGAGKSTSATFLLRDELAVDEFVNADVIAEGLTGQGPEATAIAAGRIMLARIAGLVEAGASFALESTLASRTLGGFLRNARTRGYLVHVIYLWVDSPDLSVARVLERVRSGGHHVPEETIRRRYRRGIENFFKVYRPLADHWWFYDNSGRAVPRLVARGGAGMVDEIIDGSTWERVDRVSEAETRDPDVEAELRKGQHIDRALGRAVKEALRMHKRLGNPIAVSEGGSVVWIPPEQIRVDD